MSIIEGLDLHNYKKKENEDFIRIYNNFLDKDLCNLLINFYNNNEKYQELLKTNNENNNKIVKIRKSIGLNMSHATTFKNAFRRVIEISSQ